MIVNRQWELDGSVGRSRACTVRVVELEKRVGLYRDEERKELINCRDQVKELSVLHGSCIVYKENLKDHVKDNEDSKALVEQAKDLTALLTKRENLVFKQAEEMNECQKHLHEVEVEARQLIKRAEEFAALYKVCNEQLAATHPAVKN